MKSIPMGDLLDQGEIWQQRTDGGLETIKIADMNLNHILNLRRWLFGNARRLHDSEVLALYSVGAMISGEAASDDLDSAISAAEGENPFEWLRDKPLYRALGQQIHHRQGATASPEQRRHLTKAERVELRHLLRPIDNAVQDAIAALSPATGMSHMSAAQWNAQLDSLVRSLRELRRK